MPRRSPSVSLEADQHHDFVRRHDLHELRIAFDALDREVELGSTFSQARLQLFQEQRR